MEAANTAAARGHHVRLYEATDQLGGHVVAGVRPPFKAEMAACITYQKDSLALNGVEVFLRHPVDASFLAGAGAEEIIVATGSDPIRPPIPGIDASAVVTAEDVLLDKVAVGDDVVVIGAGSVGVETAEFLIARGKRVTVVEMADDILADMAPAMRAPLEARVKQTATRFELGQKVLQIRHRQVVTDKQAIGPCDTVVLSVGYQPDTALARALDSIGLGYALVGDAVEPRKIIDAVREGFEAAYAIA